MPLISPLMSVPQLINLIVTIFVTSLALEVLRAGAGL